MIEVVPFSSTLTHTGKYRIAGVLNRDVTNQLHHVDGLTNTGTTEQSDFSALRERSHQVDYLNACFE